MVSIGGWIKYTADLRRERNEAMEARREAELREGEAREIAGFVSDIFSVSNRSEGENITARALLEQKAEKVAREMGDRPVEKARLIDVIAGSFMNLGLYDQAGAYAMQAYNLRREALGDDDLAIAESLLTLASIEQNQYHHENVARYRRQALEIQLQHLGEDDPLVASTKCGLASSLGYLGQLEEADTLSLECLETLRKVNGDDDEFTLAAFQTRAIVLRQIGRTDEAEAIYVGLLERQKTIHGPRSLDVAQTLNNLAYLLKTRGDLEGAVSRYRESMEIQDEILDRGHPWSIMVRQNLAGPLNELGRYDEVERYLYEVLELRRELHPEGHSEIASTIVAGIGRFLMDRGKYAEAEPLLREAVAICEASMISGAAYTETARGSLGACLFGLGQTNEANRLVRRSLAALESRDDFPRSVVYNIPWVAKQLEAVDQPEFAARFRALVE